VREREAASREQVLAFGPFQLLRTQKVLLEDGAPVRLGSRALDLLIALVERAGEVVSKNELISYAWPNTYVEDNNLRVHVAALRKLLGDGQKGLRYIVNVPGRGYSFIASMSRADATYPTLEVDTKPGPSLPALLTRVVGRSSAVAAAAAQMSTHRLVTIVGPGGIGKSTVGLAVANQLGDRYAQRILFVDLAAIEDPALVPATVATVVGISALTADPIGSLTAHLKDARMLLVLDNCEHVIACVAELVDRIMRSAPGVDFIATSREPMLVEGEYVLRLSPLDSPTPNSNLTAKSAIEFSAVQLFVERAMSRVDSFELTDQNAPLIAKICRWLDGLPLAIELTAALVATFGIEALAARLDQQLLLLATGRRTARTRHQSLRATLDWSYQTLAPHEQTMLRKLSVFRGSFSIESAAAVITDAASIDTTNTLEGIIALVGKSLLSTEVSDQSVRYRLLQVTRAYAAEKLLERGEGATANRRHAAHHRDLLEVGISEWNTLSRAAWIALYGPLIDEVRAALEWAFLPGGDIEIGTSLTVASIPYGFQMSLIDEYKTRANLALKALAEISPARLEWELSLCVALAALNQHSGEPVDVVRASLGRALEVAAKMGANPAVLPAMVHQPQFALEFGEDESALRGVKDLQDIATQTDDPIAKLIADRVGAQVHHFVGDQSRARTLAERVLRYPINSVPLSYGQTPVDKRVSMRIILARILWIDGKADQARQVIAEGIEWSQSDGPSAICQALGFAGCPIALWSGDVQLARRLIDDLLESARRFTYARWYRVGLCFNMALSDLIGGSEPSRSMHSEENVAPMGIIECDTMATMSDRWIDSAIISRAERALPGWCGGELNRIVGVTLLTRGTSAERNLAEIKFQRALQISRDKGLLAWELRAATNLAELWRDRDERVEALNLLLPIYERFTEGLQTRDLLAAKTVLDQLL
jgi:predicted ATPase/DNA-binding winged helix-turn-helix (wHTH) protein